MYFLSMEKCVALQLNKLESSSPQTALFQARLTLAQWFINFFNIILLFRHYLTYQKVWPFLWPNLNPLTLECFVHSLTQWFWRRSLFRYYLLLVKGVALLFNKLESQRMPITMFGWHWSSGSGEDDMRSEKLP